MRRWLLAAARDCYGRHYDDLTPKQQARCMELAALAMVESEEGAKGWPF